MSETEVVATSVMGLYMDPLKKLMVDLSLMPSCPISKTVVDWERSSIWSLLRICDISPSKYQYRVLLDILKSREPFYEATRRLIEFSLKHKSHGQIHHIDEYHAEVFEVLVSVAVFGRGEDNRFRLSKVGRELVNHIRLHRQFRFRSRLDDILVDSLNKPVTTTRDITYDVLVDMVADVKASITESGQKYAKIGKDKFDEIDRIIADERRKASGTAKEAR